MSTVAICTICTILKKREEIKKFDVAKGVKAMHSTKQRPKLLEDVEKLLMLWINDKQSAGDSISEHIICAKAKALYLYLIKRHQAQHPKMRMHLRPAVDGLRILEKELVYIV